MAQTNHSRKTSAAILVVVCLSAPLVGEEVRADGGCKGACTASELSRNSGTSRISLNAGDRIKITFFEMVGAANGAPAGDAASALPATLHTFFQRMDLSGEYVVDEEGMISLPRLGRVPAAGNGLDDLQAALTASFGKMMGRPADVNVAILERQPVYILGPVKNPGAYKYVPDMTVLHAVALAGGLDRDTGSVSGMIQGLHEVERVRKSGFDLKRLLARRARLAAQLDGGDPVPTKQLVAVAGEQAAGMLLASEVNTMRAEKSKYERQETQLDMAIKAARKELDALKHKLAQLDIQRDLRNERLRNMESLMARGLTTRGGIINIRSELADIEARRQDYHLAVVQGEARLAQAERARDWLATDTRSNIAQAIAATDLEIAEARQTLKSAEMVADIVAEGAASVVLSRSPVAPAYEVVRKSANGQVTLAVSETSALRPGDVLKVTLKRTAPAVEGSGLRQKIKFALDD